MDTLKIASWNINSVRFRLDIVERFLRESQPDILCLQETKVIDGDFPHAPFHTLGYRHIAINGQRMHHGVAVISRVPLAEDDRLDWQANGEARHIGVRLENGLRLENVYVPAGGDIPDRELNPKFGQKLDFVERMTRWSEGLGGVPTLLVGDFNIAPLECDVWSHKQLLNVVSHTPIEVDHLAQAQEAGKWVDVTRADMPEGKLYSWWSYRAADWTVGDRGRRLDHIWVSRALKDKVADFRILRDARGWTRPSDHVPVTAVLDL